MPGSIQVPSPGFTTHPPAIVNAELIPDDIRAAMAATWDVRHHAERMVTLHRLRDVYVVGEGLVFGRDMEVVQPSITQHSPSEIEDGRRAVQLAVGTGVLYRQPDPHVLCLKRGATNYGHWLVEMLPVAWLMLQALQDGELSVLVPSGPLGAVPRDSLDLLGVPARQVRGCDGAPLWFDTILLVENLTWHGTYLSPLTVAALGHMARDVAPGAPAQVWVSRSGTHRCFWDEDQVAAVLAGMGWTIAHPGRMTLREQVALFKGARHIAGVAGAGLTNLVFAAPGARITSFSPAGMPDTFFWMLSELRGHAYADIRCRHGRSTGTLPWDGGMVMPLPSILAHLT